MQLLKQSTAITITLGPAVDPTDGVTPVTTLAKATVDEVGVYKHQGTSLVDLSAIDITHRAGGMYTTQLAVGTVDTLGMLTFYVRDDSACLPIWEKFMVVPANVWDSLFGADKLQVHAAEITNGLIVAGTIGANALTAEKFADDAIDKILDELVDATGATVSLRNAIKEILAATAHPAARSGNAYAYKDKNGDTLFTLTLADTARTRS